MNYRAHYLRELTLSEKLQVEQTLMENDRTLMSYVQLSSVVFISVILLVIFNQAFWITAGFLIVSVIIMVIGFYRHAHLRESLEHLIDSDE